ncbi:MAG: amidohydrolase [Bacteroidota bacterium]|nr:amidohydrolase [Rhodothermia bacterium]MCS7155683.1 amidohydrolase [Bacteroidota bacterium]MDW8137177.1 amidohydrolase [Bacteroidota bacterium]MDW8284953.1 amidohydrolase [Bacteroidota bacterium]
MDIAWRLLGAVLLAGAPLLAGAQGPARRALEAASQRVRAWWPAQADSALALYRELHQNPELAFQERRTAARLSAVLRRAGLEVHEGIGQTGIVGVLRNGQGPVILVRTDLDGLPVEEQTGLPYASRARAERSDGSVVPTMHACGHDVHMATWVATARFLAAHRDLWRGTILFVGQPAEEIGAGAAAMLADGFYERFPRPEAALALHVDPNLPVGTVGYVLGPAFAHVNSVDVTIYGLGGHGAAPHKAVDPIVLAAEYVLLLQTIRSRMLDPMEPAVVTVGFIRGGTQHNIIPDRVELGLTIRTYSASAREQIFEALRRLGRGLAEAYGLPPERYPKVTISPTETPSTVNTPELTRRIVEAWRQVWPSDRIQERRPETVGEDFGRFGMVSPPIPTFMFRLGTTPQEAFARGDLPSLHSPFYAPDAQGAIPVGLEAMVLAIVSLAGR